jgi:glutathione S-transferase
MLELHHYEPYANSMKCLICLEEKRLAFKSRYVDILRFEQHTAAFVKINPNGQVPVLIHDGKTIVESSVINEYLDDVFPEMPLRPSDPAARARMRVWGKWVDEVLMQSVSMIGWQVRFRPLAQSIDRAEFAERMKRVPLREIREKWEITAGPGFSEAALEDSRRKIRWFIGRMEKTLSEGPCLAGKDYSLADINAYPMIEGVTRLCKEAWNERDAPRSIEWLARVNARPAVKTAFGYSRFKNVPGRAQDADKVLRA